MEMLMGDVRIFRMQIFKIWIFEELTSGKQTLRTLPLPEQIFRMQI